MKFNGKGYSCSSFRKENTSVLIQLTLLTIQGRYKKIKRRRKTRLRKGNEKKNMKHQPDN